MFEFVDNRPRIACLVVAVACLAGGGVIGRVTAPTPEAKVIVQEKIVEKEKLVIDEKRMEEEITKRVAEIKKETDRHTVKHEVIKPDGTRETTTTTDTHSTTTEVKTEIKYVDRIVEREVTKYVDREVVKTVTIEPQLKQWRASLMAGVQPGLFPPTLQPWAVGAHVERRVAGPVWAGVWTMGNFSTAPTPAFNGLQAGISVGLEF